MYASRKYGAAGIVSFRPGERQPPALAALLPVQQLACDASQKGRQGSPRRVELGGVMNEPYENILRNLSGFEPIASHIEREPEYGWVVGSVERSERFRIAFVEPFNQMAIGDALGIHARI